MSQDLLIVYHQALYAVKLPQSEIILKVGERNQQLIELLHEQQAQEWAYLTAANPHSQLLSPDENESRNQQLISVLKKEKFVFFEGEGRSAEGDWPSERSFLVLAISEKEAVHLAKHFNQAGFLIGTSSGVPVLRMLE